MEMLRACVETLKMDEGSAWMDVVNAERAQGKTHQDKQMEIGDHAAPRCPHQQLSKFSETTDLSGMV